MRIWDRFVLFINLSLGLKVAVVLAALCILITGYLFFSAADVAEAGFFENFKQTIMDIFGMSEEEMEQAGVESEKIEAVSKPDLMMELQEIVMDTQNIYAVIKITASSVGSDACFGCVKS